jgi:glycerate 2-kinase
MPTERFRVLVSPDKFKGSAGAAEAAERLTRGLRRAEPDWTVRALPVADGGEGTVDAAVSAGFERRSAVVPGPVDAPVRASFALRDGTAVVELAEASGLRRLARRGGNRAGPGEPALDPLRAHTRGTGGLLAAALDAGAAAIVLGAGGSASTDGGTGLLSALGARFLDGSGRPVPDGGGGLDRIASADLSGLDPRLRHCRLLLASDVDNPLLGTFGAAAVYGPQKGATSDDVAFLDAGLRRLVEVLTVALGQDAVLAADLPGAGAAGGVGYAALAVLGAKRRPGIDLVLETIGFHAALAETDLVITGEGCLDPQTLRGKAPAGVADAARARGIPVVAGCGRLELDPEQLAAAGFARAYSLADLEPDPGRSMAEAGPLLERLGEQIARDWRRGRM